MATMTERQRWGFVFLLAGLIAMPATLFVTTSWFAAVLAIVLWALTIYSGYRIWRAGHPAGSVTREIARRVVGVASAVVTGAVGVFVLALVQAKPLALLVAVAVVLGGLFTFLMVGTLIIGRDTSPIPKPPADPDSRE